MPSTGWEEFTVTETKLVENEASLLINPPASLPDSVDPLRSRA